MKKSKYSESRIVSILKKSESGVPVAELCHQYGMSDAAFTTGVRNSGVWMCR